MGKRLIYQDWIAEMGRYPGMAHVEAAPPSTHYNPIIVRAVTQALNDLESDQARFIRAYYFYGKSYREISRSTGKSSTMLQSLHQRALKKLARSLYVLLGRRYNIPCPRNNDCPLCLHPRSAEIDRLLRAKPEAETWCRIVAILRDEFNLETPMPSRIIGHMKYHMI
jgi:predicted DNA-binding protein (UPF0251 family)